LGGDVVLYVGGELCFAQENLVDYHFHGQGRVTGPSIEVYLEG
jgi:hypothetical protein